MEPDRGREDEIARRRDRAVRVAGDTREARVRELERDTERARDLDVLAGEHDFLHLVVGSGDDVVGKVELRARDRGPRRIVVDPQCDGVHRGRAAEEEAHPVHSPRSDTAGHESRCGHLAGNEAALEDRRLTVHESVVLQQRFLS